MLGAVITDLLAIPDCNVITCVEEQLPTVFPQFQIWETERRLHVDYIKEPEEELRYFKHACQQADVVWIIAPEFDELLYSRTKQAMEWGASVVGPDLPTIKLTSDKWRLFQTLNEQALPTIPTSLFENQHPTQSQTWPCIIKHRFGAGGLGFQYLAGLEDWHEKLSHFPNRGDDYILQPFISGKMLSTVMLLNSHCRQMFPVGVQKICLESGFEYQGGVIPADLSQNVLCSIEDLLRQVCDVIPGLKGYIGFDLLLPDVEPLAPLIVEINPRLTTSYTGYRQLTLENLAERIIKADTEIPLLRWKTEQGVQFCPDGTMILNKV